ASQVVHRQLSWGWSGAGVLPCGGVGSNGLRESLSARRRSNYLRADCLAVFMANTYPPHARDSRRNRSPANTLDAALLVDVYHELHHAPVILRSIRRDLKAGGNAVIEHRKEDPTIPIADTHRMKLSFLDRYASRDLSRSTTIDGV